MPEQPAAEKTEQPTPKRLEKARGQGQVPQSQELASVAVIIGLAGSLAVLGVFGLPGIYRFSSRKDRRLGNGHMAGSGVCGGSIGIVRDSGERG